MFAQSFSALRAGIGDLARGGLRVVTLPPREVATTLHVVVIITVVESLLRWVSLPRLSRILGLRVNLDPVEADGEPIRVTELEPKALRQLRCTHRVAEVWPFAEGPCLRRTLVAGHLLRRKDPSVRLGVGGTGDDLSAHAWLEIDDRPLEGVSDFNVFQRATGATA